MSWSRKQRIGALVIVSTIIVVLDQFTKHLVIAGIPLHGGFEVVPGFVDIVHARNPGAAFGILADSVHVFRSYFFIFVSIVALATISWLTIFSKELDFCSLAGFSLFFGGALGNLIDRIRFGEVIDFIDLHFGELHWPAFNVADSMLCLGVAFFLIRFIFKK